ncbi:hypothetical protein ACOACO_03715 [Nocardioides sp. CPCC 205120]|uniref:hypothetical protein n=1 Tax=Nocardioides sp. CPCC 205120 TaxID=3406462 RepID=UPI003B50FFA7
MPSVGEVAVVRGDDGTLQAHVKLCDGGGPLDGVTVYGFEDSDAEGASENVLLEIDAAGEVTDASSWILEDRAGAPLAFDEVTPNRLVGIYGWTDSNQESLDGPEGSVAVWRAIEPGQVMKIDGSGETVVQAGSIDEWLDDPCWNR